MEMYPLKNPVLKLTAKNFTNLLEDISQPKRICIELWMFILKEIGD